MLLYGKISLQEINEIPVFTYSPNGCSVKIEQPTKGIITDVQK
jgi:hypothetical protein